MGSRRQRAAKRSEPCPWLRRVQKHFWAHNALGSDDFFCVYEFAMVYSRMWNLQASKRLQLVRTCRSTWPHFQQTETSTGRKPTSHASVVPRVDSVVQQQISGLQLLRHAPTVKQYRHSAADIISWRRHGNSLQARRLPRMPVKGQRHSHPLHLTSHTLIIVAGYGVLVWQIDSQVRCRSSAKCLPS